jgi:hypothetical protein
MENLMTTTRISEGNNNDLWDSQDDGSDESGPRIKPKGHHGVTTSPPAASGPSTNPPPPSGEPPPGSTPPPETSTAYLGQGSDLPALLNIGTFSPEMILQYVQTRLADIDGQMADIMGDANDKKAKSEELRRFQEAVRSLSGVGSNGPGFDTSHDENDVERAKANSDAIARLEKAKADLKDNPELVARLQSLESGLLNNNKFFLSGESIQNQLDWAKDQLTSLNSMNELTMMRLNQLVQTRSQIISAASNAQASINEGVKNVIGNMRA